MRSSRNEHVIESVRLPELIAQSLEVVPDACRQRLLIHADESLGRIGVVQVARTVLRLVLQNLIINASDAVRDAGKDQGVLRLSAAHRARRRTATAAPAVPGRRRRHRSRQPRPGIRERDFPPSPGAATMASGCTGARMRSARLADASGPRATDPDWAHPFICACRWLQPRGRGRRCKPHEVIRVRPKPQPDTRPGSR
jgi:hypothetical protein